MKENTPAVPCAKSLWRSSPSPLAALAKEQATCCQIKNWCIFQTQRVKLHRAAGDVRVQSALKKRKGNRLARPPSKGRPFFPSCCEMVCDCFCPGQCLPGGYLLLCICGASSRRLTEMKGANKVAAKNRCQGTKGAYGLVSCFFFERMTNGLWASLWHPFCPSPFGSAGRKRSATKKEHKIEKDIGMPPFCSLHVNLLLRIAVKQHAQIGGNTMAAGSAALGWKKKKNDQRDWVLLLFFWDFLPLKKEWAAQSEQKKSAGPNTANAFTSKRDMVKKKQQSRPSDNRHYEAGDFVQ